MSLYSRIVFIIAMICLVAAPGFSQDDQDQPVKEQSKTEGLRKIATGSGLHDLDIDIHLDEDNLEATIESAVELAMESVEATLDALQIHIDPIEIDLSELDLRIDPIEINIPDVDLDIEFDMEDIDLDNDDFERNDDDGKTFRKADKENDDVKDRSDKNTKDKSKGLKRIN